MRVGRGFPLPNATFDLLTFSYNYQYINHCRTHPSLLFIMLPDFFTTVTFKEMPLSYNTKSGIYIYYIRKNSKDIKISLIAKSWVVL